MRVSMVLD